MNGHSHATKLGRSGDGCSSEVAIEHWFSSGRRRLHAEFGRHAAVLLAKADFTSRLVVDAGIPG
jgi:hypothetical protein